jgi:heat shock protein HslJ
MQPDQSMKRMLLFLCLCAGLLILSGCGTFAAQQGDKLYLTRTVWNLSALIGKAFATGSDITAEFTSDGKVSGFSGCNQYEGVYRVNGNDILISSLLTATMKACPPEIMAQEIAYLEALAKARTFTASPDQLTLNDAGDNHLLAFHAQTQQLAGSSWEVTGYNNGNQAVTSVLAGTNITAQFTRDGTLLGNSSCNDYSGPYKVVGNQIEIGTLASSKKACADPDGVMDQEAQYLAALKTAATYKIEGKGLELRAADGALVVDYTNQ